MYLNFKSKRISGVASVIPEQLFYMEDEVANPNDAKTQRLKRIIGYGSRRRAKATTTLSDLLLYGLNKLIDDGQIKKSEIGAIVVCTLSEDYVEPQLSCIIQGELGLDNSVLCIDSPQACAGFVVGLIHAFMYLEHLGDKKVILCTGEVFNRQAPVPEPKFEHPSFGGDIANITVIENSDDDREIFCSVFNDGANGNALVIKDGEFRSPMTPEKLAQKTNGSPYLGVTMDGSAVFNFVQREVPPALTDLVTRSGKTLEDIDYFVLHQPNRFMLEKLADSLGIPYEKVPMELTSTLGNSDSGTIPAVMTNYIADVMLSEKKLYCFSGFGAGLTWASVVMENDKLDFCCNILSDL